MKHLMKYLTAPLAFMAVVLALGASAHTGDQANDSDMDSIPDHLDECPSDPSNTCEQARRCLEARQGQIAMQTFSVVYGMAGLGAAAIPGGQGAAIFMAAVSLGLAVGSMIVEAYWYEECPSTF